MLPKDWQTRVNKIQNENTSGYAGYCLDVLDLFLAKAAAGRDKDREFCVALLQYKYLTAEEAIQKVPLMDVESRPEFGLTTRTLLARIRRWAKDAAIG